MSPESKGEMNQDATEEELKNVNEETTGKPCQISLRLEILCFNSFLCF